MKNESISNLGIQRMLLKKNIATNLSLHLHLFDLDEWPASEVHRSYQETQTIWNIRNITALHGTLLVLILALVLLCFRHGPLTFVCDLLLSVLGGGNHEGGHVVDVSGRLLQRVQLLVVAVRLHLGTPWNNNNTGYWWECVEWLKCWVNTMIWLLGNWMNLQALNISKDIEM